MASKFAITVKNLKKSYGKTEVLKGLTMNVERELLDLAKSPWLSTGIGASAEPQAHRDGPYREGNPEDAPTANCAKL